MDTMRKRNSFYILTILILASICIYQILKKEKIYISFEEIPGYKYQFIDSTNIQRTSKILITQGGTLAYQKWEVDIDSDKIFKTDITAVRKIVVSSQYIIINNYGGIKDCERNLKKLRFFVLKWDKNTPYILPVKQIRFVVE